jgi:hypothetical protein
MHGHMNVKLTPTCFGIIAIFRELTPTSLKFTAIISFARHININSFAIHIIINIFAIQIFIATSSNDFAVMSLTIPVTPKHVGDK